MRSDIVRQCYKNEIYPEKECTGYNPFEMLIDALNKEISSQSARMKELEAENTRLMRHAEIYMLERDGARACYDKTIKILWGIYALLNPPFVRDSNGAILEFSSPNKAWQIQELSDRIRAIPDELEALNQKGSE